MKKVKLAVLEDSGHVRQALGDFFYSDNHFELTHLASDADEILGLADLGSTELLLCDIGLPGKSGIELTWILKNKYPEIQVLIFTVFEDEDKIFEAIRAGAAGYLLKSASLPELKKALLEVAAGGSAMSPTIARKVMDFFKPVPLLAPTGLESLTEQELEIVRRVVEGQNNRSIAYQLCISIDTVKYHIKKIYKKLHVNSRRDLERTFLHDFNNR